MPTFNYTVADFIKFTKILSADVNARFQDIKDFLNVTKLNNDNLQDGGIDRADKLEAGTANHVVINDGTGKMSSEAQLATTRGGLGFSPSISLSTAGQAVKVNTAGTGFELGTVASGLGLEYLEQKLKSEHYGIIAEALDNSLGSGFYVKPFISGITSRLLQDYSTGTTIYLAHNPVFVNDSDKDFDTTSGWAAQGAGANLTTSATHKIGTASLSFDKDGSATNARIRYNRTAVNFGVPANYRVWFWINLPSLTNLVDVEFRMDIDGTNYKTWNLTTDYAGSPLQVGWNLMFQDLSIGGTGSGTSWNTSQLAQYIHIGVNTSSAGQTYTAILVDALMFSYYTPSQLGVLGQEYTIYNSTNKETFIVDAANTRYDGPLTITAGLSNAYEGGGGSGSGVIQRHTLTIADTVNQASFTSGLGGAITTSQEIRLAAALRESQTSVNFDAFANINTPQIYEITTVGGSSIGVTDPANTSANLVSGNNIHIFRTINVDGRKYFVHRGDLSVTSSSHSSGTTTINGTPPAGTVVGDYAAKDHLTASISLSSLTDNDSFSSLTREPSPNGVILYDTSIPYPNAEYVWAHWHLGGVNQTEAIRNRQGTGPALSVAGTLNYGSSFRNGQFLASGWTTSNAFSIDSANSEEISGDSADVSLLQISGWLYYDGVTNGSIRHIISRYDANNSVGWYIAIPASTAVLQFNPADGTAHPTNIGTLTTGFNFFTVVLRDGGVSYGRLNGVKGPEVTFAINDPSRRFLIGACSDAFNGIVYPATNIPIGEIVIQKNGPELTADQHNAMYNAGLHVRLGFGPQLKYRMEKTALTGQRLTLKLALARTTTAVQPYIERAGAIKA